MACRPHSCVWGQILTRRAGRTQGQPAPAGSGRHERRLSRLVKQIWQPLTPRPALDRRCVMAGLGTCCLGCLACSLPPPQSRSSGTSSCCANWGPEGRSDSSAPRVLAPHPTLDPFPAAAAGLSGSPEPARRAGAAGGHPWRHVASREGIGLVRPCGPCARGCVGRNAAARVRAGGGIGAAKAQGACRDAGRRPSADAGNMEPMVATRGIAGAPRNTAPDRSPVEGRRAICARGPGGPPVGAAVAADGARPA